MLQIFAMGFKTGRNASPCTTITEGIAIILEGDPGNSLNAIHMFAVRGDRIEPKKKKRAEFRHAFRGQSEGRPMQTLRH
jgi:hypothetical protein